ncbi:MAG: hypothetical protein M9921_06755 [Fimbriimonadaceae bacterium]|nr:hypothetical protein [Chthonomonadaceae bacterium]MCO5296537.1 hypothetical protein [Fimbriimonadaceae bacterium]
MIRHTLAESKVNALLGRLVVGCAVVCALVLAVLGASGLYFGAQRSQAVEAVRADKDAIKQAMDTLDRSRSVKAVGGVEGLAAVNAFQRFFVEKVTGSGCTVKEVVASSEGQPYVTKFNKDTPPNEYVQLGFKSSIVGSPSQVLAALRALGESQIPFEMDTLTLRRSSVAQGHSILELAFELRVLAKGGAA